MFHRSNCNNGPNGVPASNPQDAFLADVDKALPPRAIIEADHAQVDHYCLERQRLGEITNLPQMQDSIPTADDILWPPQGQRSMLVSPNGRDQLGPHLWAHPTDAARPRPPAPIVPSVAVTQPVSAHFGKPDPNLLLHIQGIASAALDEHKRNMGSGLETIADAQWGARPNLEPEQPFALPATKNLQAPTFDQSGARGDLVSMPNCLIPSPGAWPMPSHTSRHVMSPTQPLNASATQMMPSESDDRVSGRQKFTPTEFQLQQMAQLHQLHEQQLQQLAQLHIQQVNDLIALHELQNMGHLAAGVKRKTQ